MDATTPPLIESPSLFDQGSPFSDYFTDSERTTPDLAWHLDCAPCKGAKDVPEYLLQSFEHLYKNYSELKIVLDAREIELRHMVSRVDDLLTENRRLKSALSNTPQIHLSEADRLSTSAETADVHLFSCPTTPECLATCATRPSFRSIDAARSIDLHRTRVDVRKQDFDQASDADAQRMSNAASKRDSLPKQFGGIWIIHPNTVKYRPSPQASIRPNPFSGAQRVKHISHTPNSVNPPSEAANQRNTISHGGLDARKDWESPKRLEVESKSEYLEKTEYSFDNEPNPTKSVTNPIGHLMSLFKRHRTTTSVDDIPRSSLSRVGRDSFSRSLLVETLKSDLRMEDENNDCALIDDDDEEETVQGTFRPFKTSRSTWGVLWQSLEAFVGFEDR